MEKMYSSLRYPKAVHVLQVSLDEIGLAEVKYGKPASNLFVAWSGRILGVCCMVGGSKNMFPPTKPWG